VPRGARGPTNREARSRLPPLDERESAHRGYSDDRVWTNEGVRGRRQRLRVTLAFVGGCRERGRRVRPLSAFRWPQAGSFRWPQAGSVTRVPGRALRPRCPKPMNRSVSASAPPVTAVAEEGASAGTRSAPPGPPASVEKHDWQPARLLSVRAGVPWVRGRRVLSRRRSAVRARALSGQACDREANPARRGPVTSSRRRTRRMLRSRLPLPSRSGASA
jgi:hypothetical protein